MSDLRSPFGNQAQSRKAQKVEKVAGRNKKKNIYNTCPNTEKRQQNLEKPKPTTNTLG